MGRKCTDPKHSKSNPCDYDKCKACQACCKPPRQPKLKWGEESARAIPEMEQKIVGYIANELINHSLGEVTCGKRRFEIELRVSLKERE